ncbi:OmpH family outer membrane protein [Gemmatimonas aurantiaca]|uniref:OmpH family outer membrane protein n=1 Tax=Gemmatimonas aurantiaca TaxID=173480 RepID=UPI00301D63EE
MRFRSLIGTCALFVVAPVVASAQGGQKIAYVNSAQLMQSAPGRAEAEATFDKEMTTVRAQLQKLQDSVNAMNEAFAKEEATLASAAKETKLKAMREKEAGFQAQAQKLQDQAQDRQEALMAPIMETLRKALEDVRTEGGYAFIFDVAVQMPYIVAADKNLDVTDRVLAKLRLAAPRAAGTAAPAASKPPAAGPASSPAGVTTKKPPF